MLQKFLDIKAIYVRIRSCVQKKECQLFYTRNYSNTRVLFCQYNIKAYITTQPRVSGECGISDEGEVSGEGEISDEDKKQQADKK